MFGGERCHVLTLTYFHEWANIFSSFFVRSAHFLLKVHPFLSFETELKLILSIKFTIKTYANTV